MMRSPRATLAAAVKNPRSLDLAALIVVISAVCSAGFLMTRVGQLAALDQQARLFESFGVALTDNTYERLRAAVPYRPAASAVLILIGWPILWVLTACVLRWFGNRTAQRRATFPQVLTVVVHASAIFAVREVVAAPINYARESMGAATSLGSVMPALGSSTFFGRLLGVVDLFVLWWVVLISLGLSIVYQVRTMPVARWLFAAYAGGAAVLALTQALRGGV